MQTTAAPNASTAELQSLRVEIAALRADLARDRLRAHLNSCPVDFALMMTAVSVVFFLTMRFTGSA